MLIDDTNANEMNPVKVVFCKSRLVLEDALHFKRL